MSEQTATEGETSTQVVEGYRAPQVCSLVNITYRQLDYWARTNLIKPSVQSAAGSGSQRLYSFNDIVQLKVVKRLLDAGMSLKRIRTAVEILRERLQSNSPLSDDGLELPCVCNGGGFAKNGLSYRMLGSRLNRGRQ